jgi:low affinity Fe/Cu permease
MEKTFVRVATLTAKFAGKPWTFMACLAIVVIWAASGPIFGFNETWQLVINTGTTIITFLMVFLIQNTQNRDGAAVQAKLDELIHAVRAADERFVGIEHLTDKDLDALLGEVEARAARIHGEAADARPRVSTRAEDEKAESQSGRASASGRKATGAKRKPASKPKARTA